jgi:hypothetical protein
MNIPVALYAGNLTSLGTVIFVRRILLKELICLLVCLFNGMHSVAVSVVKKMKSCFKNEERGKKKERKHNYMCAVTVSLWCMSR